MNVLKCGMCDQLRELSLNIELNEKQ